ncbi:MAG: DsrE/DsrF/DrsH-like family protein [Myxococcales bacterium]|nr:DsrE/DsrF/DrsH-like family protein [Myxococcales bacterium]
MTTNRKVAIIVSHGGLDEVYPALILANGARMEGIECVLFFTFYGLDAVTKEKVDSLHVNMVGNPTSPVPTMLMGLPGMETMAAKMMQSKMTDLDLPNVREMLEILDEAGAEIYGCLLAMDMFGRTQDDLVPQVKDIITVGDFYDMSEGAQIIFT